MRGVFLLLALFLLNACGGSSSNNSSDSDIVGTWVVPCTAEEFAFVVRTLVFTPDLWSSTIEGFSDSSCQTAGLVTSGAGTYVIGGYTMSSEGLSVRELTLNELDNNGAVISVESGVFHIENDVLFLGVFDDATGIPSLNFDRAWEKQ